MSQKNLAVAFFLTAVVLTPLSMFLVMAYAGPEPFEEYHRADALTHIGLATGMLALWTAWSLGVIGLVIGGVFRARALATLLLPAVSIFYLSLCPDGYLFDLEHSMLAPEQQERIGVPVREYE